MWEQITLHDIIIQHDLPRPEFKKWLTSPNDTVVMFALRMIREFRQTDTEQDIVHTFSHRSQKVKRLAIQVAGDLGLKQTLDVMKRMYKNEEYNVCLEIVRSMGKMPDLTMMGFLKLVLDKEEDVQLQIAASKAIQNMGQEGVDALNKLLGSEYKNYSIIIKHVLDKRIM
jgi:HEAT repeat protein